MVSLNFTIDILDKNFLCLDFGLPKFHKNKIWFGYSITTFRYYNI